MAEFADIASYQRGADLAAYARARYDRILLKASESTGYVNPYFGLWWRAGHALGLATGAYHFAKPSRSSGAAEAEHFHRTLRAVGGLGPRDWVCLDAEDPDERGPAAARHAAEFCHRMVELGYPTGVVYTGTWYAEPARLTAAVLPEGWRWLHIANYGKTPDDRVPLPPGWDRAQVAARQYTSTARQAGIPGGSDANRVVREWLPDPEEDEVTPQDREAIADLVLAKLQGQIFSVLPPIRQDGKAGVVIGATYNKVGDAQAALARIAEQVGLVGVGVSAARQETAIVSGKVDALMTAVGAMPATAELAPLVTSDTTEVERMLTALLDHLGVDLPPEPVQGVMAAGGEPDRDGWDDPDSATQTEV